MKGIYKGFEGPNKNGFYTAIIEGKGLPTKFFGFGKRAPKTASGTTVEFEMEEREVGDKTYYSIKGALREVEGAPAGAASTSNNGGGYGGSTNASIENQVALKCAVEFALGSDSGLKGVGDAFKVFQGLLQPQTAPKPKPKPVEEQSQDPDDQDLPY